MSQSDTTVPVSKEPRENVLRRLKRGGESYDELFQKMTEQYEPEPVGVNTYEFHRRGTFALNPPGGWDHHRSTKGNVIIHV